MKRWAIYARHSSDLQNPKSCHDQIYECELRITSLGGMVVKRYSDEGVSGAHEAQRPQYVAMISAMKSGVFDAIMAEDMDRLNRNLEASARLYSLSVRDDVEIWTLSDGRISQMHTGFKGLMSELFLAGLADKTRRGMMAAAREGRYAAGNCYGYTVSGLGLRVINPEQCAIVRRIYDEYASGVAPVKICGALNAEKIAAPRGAEWRMSTLVGNLKRLNGILSNPVYIGKPVFNRQRFVKDPETGKRFAKPNSPDLWIHQDLPHLKIIADDVWQTVQTRRENRGGIRGTHLMRRPKTLLSGLIRCEECGSPMALNGQYYRCTAHTNAGTCEMNRGLRSDQIEAWVVEGLKTALDQPEIVAEYVRHLHDVFTRLDQQKADGAEAEIRKAQDIDRRILNLMTALEDGRASEIVMARLKELQQEKTTSQLNHNVRAPKANLVRMIPDAPDRFRRQLSEALSFLSISSARATAARERVRSMIARIGAKRTDKGLWIEVDGDLGAILQFTERPESWPINGCGS